MHKYRALTKVLLKNNMNVFTDGKGKRSKDILIYMVIAVSFLLMAAVIYTMFSTYFEIYGTIAQTGTVLTIGFFLGSFLIFFFSLFVIPSIFYFSKDNDVLLTLPIKPQMILSAKFISCLLYDLSFSCLVVLPLAIAYMQYMPFGIWELLCFILIAMTLPIIPLIYSSIITMLVMRFVPFVKNRDAFNMISGILIVVFSLSLSFYINSLGAVDEAELIMMLLEGGNSMMKLFSILFPFLSSAALMIFDGSFWQLCLYILWQVAFIALFLFIGKYIYFKGAIGINESSSSSRRIDLRTQIKKTPIFRCYMIKECRLLLRTPAYFLNCIFSVAIMPIMIAAFSFQPEIRMALSYIDSDEILAYPQASYYIILVILIISCFIAPLNMVASTAISREGDHVSFMKYIPVSYETQLYAKCSISILLGIITILPLWILVIVFLNFPPMLSILSLIGILLSNIALSMIGILIDSSRPKLIWEQEASAVKQNLNGILELAIGILLSVLIGAGMYMLNPDKMVYLTAGIMVSFLILIVLCHFIIRRHAGKLFEKIS